MVVGFTILSCSSLALSLDNEAESFTTEMQLALLTSEANFWPLTSLSMFSEYMDSGANQATLGTRQSVLNSGVAIFQG